MDKKLKTRWVKALCSGEYKQGRGYLRMRGRYCCLGVLAELADVESYTTGFIEDKSFRARLLPNPVQRELGKLNDEGVPFEVIAGLINAAL